MSTIIDIYCHIYPGPLFPGDDARSRRTSATSASGCAASKAVRPRRALRGDGPDSATTGEIISLPNPAIEDIAPPGRRPAARRASPTIGWPKRVCRKHPRAVSEPSPPRLCLTDVDGSVEPKRSRAVKDLGARGVLDLHQRRRRAARPAEIRAAVQACMAELDLPIWLHPVGTAALHGLSGGEEIALRDVVVLPLALRDLGRHGAAWCSSGCSTATPSSRSSPTISAA